MPKITRRIFLKNSIKFGVATLVLTSYPVFAEWPAKMFSSEKQKEVIRGLFGHTNIEASSMISIKAPEIAENGAVVPITIDTDLPNVESVSILVEKNPKPLVAQFAKQPNHKTSISTRIKLAERSNVTAIVKSNGKLYSSTKFVKVTRGGCGG